MGPHRREAVGDQRQAAGPEPQGERREHRPRPHRDARRRRERRVVPRKREGRLRDRPGAARGRRNALQLMHPKGARGGHVLPAPPFLRSLREDAAPGRFLIRPPAGAGAS
ncbi:protein of unknown function [Microbacterium sp. Nx66]|nr:protein of unknown function [Microbacterium sp. Nx66]